MLAMLIWSEINWSSNYCCENGDYLKGRYIQDNNKKKPLFSGVIQDWHPQHIISLACACSSTLPEIQRKHLI